MIMWIVSRQCSVFLNVNLIILTVISINASELQNSTTKSLSSNKNIIVEQHSSSLVQMVMPNCTTMSDMCSNDLKLICDHYTGECKCSLDSPVRLSPEIPCLKYKKLGELCIHSAECGLTPHAFCIATFLFSIKVLSKTPTYKQWFFYNKIHNDDDMNYLLNKLYGRCRCGKGFRAIDPYKCTYAGVEAPFRCNHEADCFSINGHCDQNRCVCSNGSHYDTIKGHCDKMLNLYGQFCAASSDCFSQQTNMECKNSICICSRNYDYNNSTGCIRRDICAESNVWNTSLKNCPRSTAYIVLVKSLPLVLIIIIILNVTCYIRGRSLPSSSLSSRSLSSVNQINHHDPSRRYTLNESTNRTSYSLLSLPDYETVFNGTAVSFEERLPSYEEAVQSLNGSSLKSDNQSDNFIQKINH